MHASLYFDFHPLINSLCLSLTHTHSFSQDDQTELIVTLTLLSLLFVVVIVAAIIALIRPGASKSGVSMSQHAKT